MRHFFRSSTRENDEVNRVDVASWQQVLFDAPTADEDGPAVEGAASAPSPPTLPSPPRFIQSQEPSVEPLTQREYSCKYCRRLFSQKGNLRAHERLHRGEREFACGVCGRAFAKKQNLKTHEIIHSGEKPYKCTGCPKAFNRKSNLKRHEKQHSGVKPFLCNYCGRGYATKHNLYSHIKMHEFGNLTCHICRREFVKPGFYRRHMKSHFKDVIAPPFSNTVNRIKQSIGSAFSKPGNLPIGTPFRLQPLFTPPKPEFFPLIRARTQPLSYPTFYLAIPSPISLPQPSTRTRFTAPRLCPIAKRGTRVPLVVSHARHSVKPKPTIPKPKPAKPKPKPDPPTDVKSQQDIHKKLLSSTTDAERYYQLLLSQTRPELSQYLNSQMVFHCPVAPKPENSTQSCVGEKWQICDEQTEQKQREIRMGEEIDRKLNDGCSIPQDETIAGSARGDYERVDNTKKFESQNPQVLNQSAKGEENEHQLQYGDLEDDDNVVINDREETQNTDRDVNMIDQNPVVPPQRFLEKKYNQIK